MTTNAALAAQVTDALTRWNDQLDQLADWLTGPITGGPNSDGRYPLTNAQGESELFQSLPTILDLVSGPAAAAGVAQAAAEAAETLAGQHKTAAELAQTQAELARDSAQNLRNETEQFRQDVAAYWAAVGTWQTQVSGDAAAAAASEANALTYADDAIFARDAAIVAQNAAQIARDDAEAYAASINPANLVTNAGLQTELDNLVGAAPGTLDTLNEIAAALGDDPNFATTVTTQLAGKSDIGHSHVIGDVTGLQTALDGKQPVGTYAQQVHSHVISEVGGLQAALDGKQAAGSYAASSHTHSIANVTGLQSALDGKLALAGGTVTGPLKIDTGTSGDALAIQGNSPTISFLDDTASAYDYYIHINDNIFYILANRGGEDLVGAGWESNHPLVLQAANNTGYLFGERMFADNYHPNADKLTTARTISLTGDVTGSVSFDGSANVSISATVADDSHNHTIANVDGLQAALDGKLSTTGTAYDSTRLGGIGWERTLQKRRTRIHPTDSTSLDSSIQYPEMGFTYGGSGEPTGPYIAFGGLGGNIDYSCQLVGAYNGGNDFRIRTRNDDQAFWNPWRTILTDGNYTSYVPTKTGGGASGTWGISITGSSASTTGNAATATKLATARNIALSGDVTGSANFDGSGNISITATVADDSHNHTYANIDGLSTGGIGGPRITTGSGYIEFGPANTSFAHIYTDRPYFYFNKDLQVSGQRVFHDAYHPNADKLTTARTINGVSFDGTANITVADSTKLPTAGGTVSGNITRSGQGAHIHHGSSTHSSGKITVSTSAPSGGSNGDIWLQV